MEKNKILITMTLLVLTLLHVACSSAESAAKYDAAMARWAKKGEYEDKLGGRFNVKVTLYTAEYIEALMRSEAERNLWTSSELEDYKYNFLKGLSIDDNIAIHVELEEFGPTAHMAPFNEMVSLWVGSTKYSPTDYDQRFNLPLQGKRDGMLYFPRYSEKTGEPLLKRDTTLRLVFKGAVSPVLENRDVRFAWDVKAENAVLAASGTAVDRLEVDRLIRRMEKLAAEKADLETQLEAKNREMEDITSRIEELQNK
ncbi:MAG: hypothetical protein LBS75_05835 [Synergistaceae bacterium]|nr:hypothetical protein [Synergistaceae bacterium]